MSPTPTVVGSVDDIAKFLFFILSCDTITGTLLGEKSLNNAARIFDEPISVSERLFELGIPQDALLAAIDYGYRQAAQCTENDAPTAAGWIAWDKIIRGLRDQLVPLGWTRDNERGYPRTVHPSGELAITAAGADEAIGTDTDPVTRSAHGPATRDAVIANQMSFLDIYPDFGPINEAVTKARVRQTWFILHYQDKGSGVIKSELSLANDMTEGGYVGSWQERIFLKDIPFDGTGMGIQAPVVGPRDTGPIDVPVTRRVS